MTTRANTYINKAAENASKVMANHRADLKAQAAAEQTRYYEQMYDQYYEKMATDGTSDGRFGGRGDLNHPGYRYERHDGEKYEGGLGPIELLLVDYWSLRRRSITFFKKNPYARGIIRRYLTNVINTGLVLAANPIAELTGMDEDSAAEWGDMVDVWFKGWGDVADTCDFARQMTFGEFQKTAYREALITGDVLILEHHNSATQMPTYEIIDGGLVQTPHQTQQNAATKAGRRIEHGVELDDKGEHLAYYVIQEDFKFKRIPARGANGRRISWLYYGTDKRMAETRGEPLLTSVMQAISEIDKYRDSVQRKATVGSLLAMFLYHSSDSKVMNTNPFTAGGAREVESDRNRGDGTVERFRASQHNPGMVIEQLPPGMEPRGFTNDTTDEKFGEFEEAIMSGVAWTLEMPFSVMRMVFGSSYSASRGEVKEFNQVINVQRDRFADMVLRPIYRSWVRTLVLTRRIEAPGMLEAARDSMKFEQWAAWTNSEWFGAVKEAVDLPKEVAGQKAMIEQGFTTHNAASRAMTGTSYSRNIKRVQRENRLKADAMRPLLELEREFGSEAVQAAGQQLALVASNSHIE
ncbi:phage portal protein [Vibrio phage CKB-S1]|nr:phage portal protein [Vibrio phage CKB-S1]